MTKYISPHTRRYIISILRAFFSSFLPALSLSLTNTQNMAAHILLSALFGAFVAGLNGVIKFVMEKMEGRI